MGRGVALASLLVVVLASALGAADPVAPERSAPPPYPLDAVAREVPKTGPLPCAKVADLVDYQGSVIRWQFPGKIIPALRERLVTFEGVARDVGVEIYGRPPSRVIEIGTFNCRRMRDMPGWLSEHALANAVDVEGFDFGPLPRDAKLPDGLPRAFANAFETRVRRHWGKRIGDAAIHARFLETLVVRLIERERARGDAFHVLLGPGYPGHDGHFHFDMAPFHLVQMFADGEPIERRARTTPRAGSAPATGPRSPSEVMERAD